MFVMGCSCDKAQNVYSGMHTGLRLPVCLVIMDGFGLAEAGPGNAISLAKKPCLDALFAKHPFARLQASGEAVGLPAGQMGNSEVGHLNIGAGRVVHQELTRINRACLDGSIAEREAIVEAFSQARKPGAALHLLGLTSDGGVHSSNQHLYALMRAACEAGVRDVRIHAFMDGRDVPPSSGAAYLDELQETVDELDGEYVDSCVSIASVSGRYYAMDRDNRWDRVAAAYAAIVSPAEVFDGSAAEAVRSSYEQGVTDEFVVPTALDSRGMRDGDVAVLFNFRPDRAREITRALTEEGFDGFERALFPRLHYVCMTEYDETFDLPIVFPKEFPSNVLADVVADAGLRQYHIAETEKYAHVTFFLNGGKEDPKANEERCLIASPKVATYDLQPEMSEPDVAERLEAAILADAADVYIVNFANCDMVGHTGVVPAAVRAVEAVDAGVGRVLSALRQKGGIALVTADHGNADKMVSEDGTPFTAHTCAPVPFVLADYSNAGLAFNREEGALCDIAPTLLRAAGLQVPEEMTGESFIG